MALALDTDSVFQAPLRSWRL